MGEMMTAVEALDRLEVDGWCVLPQAIPSGAVEEIRRRVEAAVERHGTVDSARRVGTRKGLIAVEQSFSPHLADSRLLEIAETLLGPHYRISFTTAHINYPENPRGPWHSDWPFNQSNAGHIPSPYPDAVFHLTTIWMLSPFSVDNGGTFIVPGSHRRSHNPSGNDGVDPMAPCAGEIQATGNAGDVLVFDSRLWHATAPNRTDRPRVALAVRFAPWWLQLDILMPGSDERKRMVEETGGRENWIQSISSEQYESLPEKVRPLFRHWVRPRP
jgi:hypothetical protein